MLSTSGCDIPPVLAMEVGVLLDVNLPPYILYKLALCNTTSRRHCCCGAEHGASRNEALSYSR